VTAPARYVEHVMGMPISLALRGRHTTDRTARDAWAEVMTELRDVDRVFSTYRPDSAISQLVRGELTLDECPLEVKEVLALAEAAERESDGAFSAWLPDTDGVRRLDPSGVVKGWATERAAAWLATLPDTDFCLSAGGDLTCRTLDPDGTPWRIGIEHPADPGRVLAVLPITTGAVATSGTAHRGAHLVDARTGRAPSDVAQVTVWSASLTTADVQATAAFALGSAAADWLRTRPDSSGLVVWADGSTTSITDN
jgi:thiamine biosynthesis lipoprotein